MFASENHEAPGHPGVLPEDAGGLETPALPGLADLVSQPPAAEPEAQDGADDWKAELRRQFEAWLRDLDNIDELEPAGPEQETPDLYSFYSQWTTANAESRKANRRTAEAFSQWGDTLGRFDGDLKLLREQLQRLAAAAPSEGLSRGHCLALAELLDRLRRLARAFATPPAASWWRGASLWRQAWENQRQAADILLGHLESLLKREGLTPIETLGRPLDPTSMTAVAAEPDNSQPDQTVLEEIAPGYRLRSELLRAAQVKVSLNKTQTPKV
jgi:molecular chaperone GrpE (heat shock protein)